jgi:hypothetical protein
MADDRCYYVLRYSYLTIRHIMAQYSLECYVSLVNDERKRSVKGVGRGLNGVRSYSLSGATEENHEELQAV